MTDYTRMGGAPVNADPDPSNGNASYYTTLDSAGTSGRPGQILVTVAYNQRQTRSIAGENFVFISGQTLWMEGIAAVYSKRDGIVTY